MSITNSFLDWFLFKTTYSRTMKFTIPLLNLMVTFAIAEVKKKKKVVWVYIIKINITCHLINTVNAALELLYNWIFSFTFSLILMDVQYYKRSCCLYILQWKSNSWNSQNTEELQYKDFHHSWKLVLIRWPDKWIQIKKGGLTNEFK